MPPVQKQRICNIMVRPYADKPDKVRIADSFHLNSQIVPKIELNLERDFDIKGPRVKTLDLHQEIAFLKMSRVEGGKTASQVFYMLFSEEVERRQTIHEYAGKETELSEILEPDEQKYLITSDKLERWLSAANFLSMGIFPFFFNRRLRAFMRDEPAVKAVLNLAKSIADEISQVLGIPKELWDSFSPKQQ